MGDFGDAAPLVAVKDESPQFDIVLEIQLPHTLEGHTAFGPHFSFGSPLRLAVNCVKLPFAEGRTTNAREEKWLET